MVSSAVYPAADNGSANIEMIYGSPTESAVVLNAKSYAEKKASFERLEAIAKLEKNWNGYDAPCIPEDVIERARNIVTQAVKLPEIFPTGRGTVQLEYHQNDGTYLELEIFTDRITVLFVDKGEYDKAQEEELRPTDYSGALRYVGYLN